MPSTVGIVASSVGNSWSYYRTVTIDNTGGNAQTNHPVRVALTSGNFTFANARTDGYDVQFRATDGSTVLRSWREAYDDGTDTAAFWVKVPSVPSNSTTTIRLYYGNPFAPDDSDITAVFPFAEDFRDIATARANLTAGVTIGSTLSPTLANSSANGEIITHGGTGYRQAEVREQSNIVWTGTEYVFLFTGVDASGQSTTGLCTAPDITGPWTEYGSTYVLPQSEDAYITVTDDGDLYTDGSGWHFVMYERKLTTGTANDDISIARTKNFRTDWEVWNGSAWSTTLTGHAAVIVRNAGGTSYDAKSCGSPTQLHDGSQFICIYESQQVGLNTTSIARSADGITWTKEASNPISTLEVIDDVQLIGSTWWACGHGGLANQYRMSTSVAPSAWNSSSFTTPVLFDYEGNSVNLAFGFDDCEKWATYQTAPGTNGLRLFNWLGSGTKWKVSKPSHTPLLGSDFDDGQGLLSSGAMRLAASSVAGSGTFAIALYTASDIGYASNFAVIQRKKQTVGPNGDDQYSITAAIGTGNPTTINSSNGGYVTFSTGYMFGVLNPDEFGPVIREYNAGAFTANLLAPNNITTAEASAFATHETRYRSTGAMDYLLDSVSQGTATDSTHVASTKYLLLGQGDNRTAARRGGNTDVEWVAVRPWDGLDPTQTVGAEVAA
jgi:hypothetical protein